MVIWSQKRAARSLGAVAAIAIVGLSAVSGEPEPAVDFNRDIRPILSDRCFKCHGFDEQARKAGLRLDTWEGLTATRKRGQPVVPGDPERSLIVARIHAEDPDDVMPPADSGLALDDAERALISRWIAEGAPFARHWGFLSPTVSPLPEVGPGARNGIDHFIFAELERRGLEPAPAADRAVLVRRLTLDLTGLPPTPEEIDGFLADDAPGAYERLVDRLLASPRFGERMALVWLDVARYADTNGFHHDNERTAWPYRDWVINAFNDNLPFDQFVIEQLAGDLLDDPTTQQVIASGFCRMHNINDEGGALDAEYRVEAICDRIETISTTFMGLTMACARCHDHKYDPLTQEDYYSLYSFFNSVEERGVYPNNGEQARAYPARLLYESPDLQARAETAQALLAAARDARDAAKPTVDAEQVEWERELRTGLEVKWVDAQLLEATSRAGASMTAQPDGSVLVGDAAATDSHTFSLRTDGRGLRMLRLEALTDPTLAGGRVGLANNGNAVVTSIRAVAESVVNPEEVIEIDWGWAWADHEQQNGDYDVHNLLRDDALGWALEGHGAKQARNALLVAREPFGFEGGTIVRVTVDYASRYAKHIIGRPRLTVATASAAVLDELPTIASDWWLAQPFTGDDMEFVFNERFGPEEEAALDRAANYGGVGWKHRPDLLDGSAHPFSGEVRAFYLARTLHSPVRRSLELSLGSDDGIKVFLNGEEVHANNVLRGIGVERDRVAVELRAGANTLMLKIVNNGGPGGFYYLADEGDEQRGRYSPGGLIPANARGASLDREFAREWGVTRSPTFATLNEAVEEREQQAAAIEGEKVPVVVMRELEKPRQTYVLDRGRYDLPDKSRPVGRRPPGFLGADLPAGAPKNRLGFARWLVRGDHPLTARVQVNRLWQMLFGAGIVTTIEDFGRQSAWPSHPALLDWLAVWFVDSGWDQKALLRLIVNSATYRQQAVVDPAAAAVDPMNRLLAYHPRTRLPAEVIRDQALFVAGLLVEARGGPSVKPYQPAGLWREVSIGGSSNTQIFRRDDGDALYRRSLYTFWKRTSPSPQMRTFDAPTREFCVVRRNTTNTPLQALVLWNDEQFLEAARVLAQRTLSLGGSPTDRLRQMYRRCTGELPTDGALAVLGHALDGFSERYQADVDDARALLEIGEAPLPDGHDPAELAAWMMVASTLLSLDQTLVGS